MFTLLYVCYSFAQKRQNGLGTNRYFITKINKETFYPGSTLFPHGVHTITELQEDKAAVADAGQSNIRAFSSHPLQNFFRDLRKVSVVSRLKNASFLSRLEKPHMSLVVWKPRESILAKLKEDEKEDEQNQPRRNGLLVAAHQSLEDIDM